MDNTELQIYLANTAHQREVADLQAAGLNPILSSFGSINNVPNIMSGDGSGSSGKTSAKAIMAAGKANPTNKALGIIEKLIDPYMYDPKNPHVRPESNITSSQQANTYTPNPYEQSLSLSNLPNNLVSSYTNSMANTLANSIIGTAFYGAGGPVAGLSYAAVARLVNKALKPVTSAARNLNVAATTNRIIHEAELGRQLSRRK